MTSQHESSSTNGPDPVDRARWRGHLGLLWLTAIEFLGMSLAVLVVLIYATGFVGWLIMAVVLLVGWLLPVIFLVPASARWNVQPANSSEKSTDIA